MTNPNRDPSLAREGEALLRSETPDEQLEELLTELDETALALREELRARREQRQALQDAERRAAQHAEIDRLEEYLAQTRVRWRNLISVLRELRDDFRKGE